MRNSIFALLPFALFLFALASSCDDDNFKNGNDNQIVLTNDNNLYEGDLYILSLEEDVSNAENTIILLQELMDGGQGTPEIELQLAEAEEQLITLNTKLAVQMGVEAQNILPPRVPRRPTNTLTSLTSCDGCLPLPNSFSYITITPDIVKLHISIVDYNSEKVIETINFSIFNPAVNYEGAVSIKPASITNFTGQVIIIVERQDVNNVSTTYSVNTQLY